MAFTVHDQPEYLTSSVLTVPHCFTTRNGGVSTGFLSSMNLGIHRGDDPENVRKNYEILGAALGFDPETLVFTKQTHSDIVSIVGRSECGEGLFREVPAERDGIITNQSGVTLTAFSADCTPVLLHDPVRHVIGAIHAGWRGTASGIVKNAIKLMCDTFGTVPSDIEAAVGPCISRCCFETDSDVPSAMLRSIGVEAEKGISDDGNGKYHVDLKEMNRIWLARSGVLKIDICNDCTACQPDRFWSHRRVGQARGSLAAVIALN